MTGATDDSDSRRTDLYVVLGATGGICRGVVAEAAARGHRVRAVSRSASSAVDLPAGVELLDADVCTPTGAAAAQPGPLSSCTRLSRLHPLAPGVPLAHRCGRRRHRSSRSQAGVRRQPLHVRSRWTLCSRSSAAGGGIAELRNPSPVAHAAAALLLLLVATALSVYKPRGMTRYGHRHLVGSKTRLWALNCGFRLRVHTR